MAKRKKIAGYDPQQLARKVLDTVVPDAAVKPAPNKAKPPRPVKKRDVQDIDRADSEGMAQPQGMAPPEKNPAAVALGRLGGLKGGKARAAALSSAKRKAIAQKAAIKRWADKVTPKERKSKAKATAKLRLAGRPKTS